MPKILTIAIPTFNRPFEVEARLQEISNLTSSLKDNIEVLICDNGSKRVTQEILSLYEVETRHVVNKSNLGLGRNIESCVINASGTYVWIISDDDLIMEENIQALLEFLLIHDLDLILLSQIDFKNKVDLITGRDTKELLWEILIFISACIFKTETCKKIIKSLNAEINETYHQVLLGLLTIQASNKFFILDNKYVKDSLTHKNYNYKASYGTRIGDFLILEKQLKNYGINLDTLSRHITSNILHYSSQLVFEFEKSFEFWYFLKRLISSKSVKIGWQRRVIKIYALILFLLGLMNYRIARMAFLLISRIARVKFIKGRIPKIEIEKINTATGYRPNDASTLGYHGDSKT